MGKRYVLTGGPGFGKSTLVNELAKKGFYAVPEAARILVEEDQKKPGYKIWKDLSETEIIDFQQRLLAKQLELEKIIPYDMDAFLDRSTIDNVAYFNLKRIRPSDNIVSEASNAKFDKVFLLEALSNYGSDAVRYESLSEAIEIEECAIRTYNSFRYDLVRVPSMPIEDRVKFVLDKI